MARDNRKGRFRWYAVKEDMEILDYIKEGNHFARVKGRAMWEGMALANTEGRSWHSLKERYIKYIIPNLKDYSIDEKLIPLYLEPFDIDGKDAVEKSQQKPKHSVSRNRRKAYSSTEDNIIIESICHLKGDLRGNEIWKRVEAKGVLKDRSWQSLRSRFLHYIFPDLDLITDAATVTLLRRRMNGFAGYTKNPSSSDVKKVIDKPSSKNKKRRLFVLSLGGHFNSSIQCDTPQRPKTRALHEAGQVVAGPSRPGPPSSAPGPLNDEESNSSIAASSAERAIDMKPRIREGRCPNDTWGSVQSLQFGLDAVTSTPFPLRRSSDSSLVYSGVSGTSESDDSTPTEKRLRRTDDHGKATPTKNSQETSDIEDRDVRDEIELSEGEESQDTSQEEVTCGPGEGKQASPLPNKEGDDADTFEDPLYAFGVPFVVLDNGLKLYFAEHFPVVLVE